MNKQTLIEQIKKYHSFLCVGLDPDIQKIPKHLLAKPDPIFEFNCAIIDATHQYCIAYKPNFAFYEMHGSEGIQSLEKTISYIRTNYPDKFIIADAKRGDIGNTSEKYAYAILKRLDCDAITLSPYMGKDAIMPFLSYPNKWAIILAITSNEGAADFQQMLCTNHKPLYQNVIEKTREWGSPENTMYVVGATHHPAIIHSARRLIPHHFILIPGIGTQGGDLKTISHSAFNSEIGILINVSRAILYADHHPENFTLSAQIQAQMYQKQMEELLKEHRLI